MTEHKALALSQSADTADSTPELLPCSVCGHGGKALFWLADDRYGYPGAYRLHGCRVCGHRFLGVCMSKPEVAALYTQYYPRSSFDVEAWSVPQIEGSVRSWWRGLRASAYRWVPAHVRVLDIGCGLGESLGYHRARGCDAHGVEADRNIERVAQRHGLNVRVGTFEPAHYEAESFDVVTLDQVIEHMASPAAAFNGIAQVLKPGGMLVVSTPNADGWGARLFRRRWVHWHAPYHVQFFSRASMTRCAKDAGLQVEQAVTVTNSAWLDFQWGHLLTMPRPGQPSSYWCASQGRSLARRVGLKLLRIVDRIGLNAAVTRLMDSVGHGDNIVYVLRKPI